MRAVAVRPTVQARWRTRHCMGLQRFCAALGWATRDANLPYEH